MEGAGHLNFEGGMAIYRNFRLLSWCWRLKQLVVRKYRVDMHARYSTAITSCTKNENLNEKKVRFHFFDKVRENRVITVTQAYIVSYSLENTRITVSRVVFTLRPTNTHELVPDILCTPFLKLSI